MCSIHSAAGEPPWPGWLGVRTRNVFASVSWKASQRPAPPAPWRRRSGGPAPPSSMWTGVPRTESSRRAGILAREEAAIRRQPLPREERAVVADEEERGGGDLARLASAPEGRAREGGRADQGRHRLGHRRVDEARTDRVDPDPARRDFSRHRAREREDRALRRAVMGRRLE